MIKVSASKLMCFPIIKVARLALRVQIVDFKPKPENVYKQLTKRAIRDRKIQICSRLTGPV